MRIIAKGVLTWQGAFHVAGGCSPAMKSCGPILGSYFTRYSTQRLRQPMSSGVKISRCLSTSSKDHCDHHAAVSRKPNKTHGMLAYADYKDAWLSPEDGEELVDHMKQASEQVGMTVVHKHSVTFDANQSDTRPGFTAVCLLDESHVTAHCYSDVGRIAVDSFTCGDRDTARLMRLIEEKITSFSPGAKRIRSGQAGRFTDKASTPRLLDHCGTSAKNVLRVNTMSPEIPALEPIGVQVKSEACAIPAAVLVCDTASALATLQSTGAGQHLWTFREKVDPDKWSQEIHDLKKTIESACHPSTKVILLNDLLAAECSACHDDSQIMEYFLQSPNMSFMRDPIVTLPWAPGRFIPSRHNPAARVYEPELVSSSVKHLGLKPLFSDRLEASDKDPSKYPKYQFDGGDIIPFVHNGTRSLLVGISWNTQVTSVARLAEELIANGHADEVIGVQLMAGRMNLDECFVPLSETVVAAHVPSLLYGLRFMTPHGAPEQFDFAQWIRDLGYTMTFDGDRAKRYDSTLDGMPTNYLCLGHNNTVVGYGIDVEMLEELSRLGINVVTVPGTELIKGDGGVRCLTRPIYY